MLQDSTCPWFICVVVHPMGVNPADGKQTVDPLEYIVRHSDEVNLQDLFRAPSQ
jgi:hypothetical protein